MTVKKNVHKLNTRLVEMAVTIISANVENGMLMVRDSYGNEFEIDGRMRAKGIGFPSPGEKWLFVKKSGIWVPDTQIGAPQIAVISGSRDGLHPLMSQLLDGLTKQGLIWDGTTVPVPPALIDPVPPIDPSDPDYDPDNPTGAGNEHDPPEVDDPGSIPTDDDGPPPDDEDPDPDPLPPSTTPTPKPKPKPSPKPPRKPAKRRWHNIYMGSYNTLKDVGPHGAYLDLHKLTHHTRLDIIGLQEAHSDARDGGFHALRSQHWNYYRPQWAPFSDENTILWKDWKFKLLNSGSYFIGHYTNPPNHNMPSRYLNWVKLQHRASKRVIIFMDTHLDPHIELGGHPRRDWYLATPRLNANFGMIHSIAEHVRASSKIAPVFVAGDWNLNALADDRVRDSHFPAAKFGAYGLHSNWRQTGTRGLHGTVGGQRYIDTIYAGPMHKWHVKAVQSWVLYGYRSDHHPMMVHYKILSK